MALHDKAVDIVYGSGSSSSLAEGLRQGIAGLTGSRSGTVYLGYPIVSNEDTARSVDALLLVDNRLLALVFQHDPDPRNVDWLNLAEEVGEVYRSLDSSFTLDGDLTHRKKGLRFAFDVQPFFATDVRRFVPDDLRDELTPVCPETIGETLEGAAEIDPTIFPKVRASVERVTNLKPRKRRPEATTPTSRGYKLKVIEKEVANLDMFQRRAAIEQPEGPQRIRGLAGSGKTVVLALKAAYLHALHPDWNIAVTYFTRSLNQHLTELIRRFFIYQKRDEPNWDKLRIMPAWGSPRSPGIYSLACQVNGLPYLDFNGARSQFGRNRAFSGACSQLLTQASERQRGLIGQYDALLIDEAQDFASTFLRLCYHTTRPPHRLVWAYDELQNLGDSRVLPPDETFGRDSEGNAFVSLDSGENEAKRDIVLPVCYRNPPWLLTAAHAIGLGLHRPRGPVQAFDDPGLWLQIGYSVIDGRLRGGESVTLRRSPESVPQFFNDLLEPRESLVPKSFDTASEEAEWIAGEVERCLKWEEVRPDDILIVYPVAKYIHQDSEVLRRALTKRGIRFHVAGVTTTADQFAVEGSVTVCSIYRAKGNESGIVFCGRSDRCIGASGSWARKARNALFTAMTRSRGWLYLSGVGTGMGQLLSELDQVRNSDWSLKFTMKTEEERSHIERIHRETTPESKKTQKEVDSHLLQALQKIRSAGDHVPVDPQLIAELVKAAKKS